MIRVLALDIAQHRTGWAFGAPGGPYVSGVYETNNWSKITVDRELDRWRRWLAAMHRDYGFAAMAIEEVFVDVKDPSRFQFSGTQAQMMLSAIVYQWCYEHRIVSFEARISHWRSHFLGFNRRPAGTDASFWKTSAIEEVRRRGWPEVKHHDEAEALGILDYALAELTPRFQESA